MTSGPDRCLAGPGCARARRTAVSQQGRRKVHDPKDDTRLKRVADEVFPIFIGNIWQSAGARTALGNAAQMVDLSHGRAGLELFHPRLDHAWASAE